jgi:tetratricopeptide (TPR) repeat protein
LGAFYSAQGNYAGAENQFNEALKVNAGYNDALAGLANLYVTQKNPEKAIQRLNQRLAQVTGPPQAPVFMLLAQVYASQKDMAHAEESYQKALQADPKNTSAPLALAEFYERNAKPDKSAQVLQAVSQKDPGNVTLKKRLATLYMQQNTPDKGIPILDEIIKANPKDTEARILRTRLLDAQGKFDDAITEAQTAVHNDANSAAARFALGLAYYAKDRRSPQVEAAWNEAIGVDPRFTPAYLSLAQLKLDSGDNAAALQYARQALRVNPNLNEAHMLMGTAMGNSKDYAHAVAEFEAYLTASPDNSTAQYRLAIAYSAMGNNPKAEQLLNDALKADPNRTESLTALVNIALIQKNPAKALQRVNEQIARYPKQPQLYELQGQVYTVQRDFPRAEQAYRKALSIDNNRLAAYTLLGQLFMAQNSGDKAIKEFENAIKLNPKSPQTWTVLGTLYDAQKNMPKAMESYRAALKIDPQSGAAANNLAWDLADSGGNLDDALNYARIAQNKMPDSTNITDTVAWVYYKRGAIKTAIDLLKGCVDKEPQNAVFQFHLGMSYFKNGQRTEARTALMQALKLNPNFPGADEAKSTLAKL